MRTVSSMPRSGDLLGLVVQPCKQYGVVVVTVQYGPGVEPHDVDIDLDTGHHSKQRQGDVFTFQVESDDAFEVKARSARWSRVADYMGMAESFRITTVLVQVELHAIEITKDTAVFVPNDEFVRLSYAIAGQPETVAKVALVVRDHADTELERHLVPRPYAATGTYDWAGALQRTMQESPFKLQMELTSDVGRSCSSNDETVAIEIAAVAIALDDGRVAAMPAGREQDVLARLQLELQGSPYVGRILYDSALFKVRDTEMDDGASFNEYRNLWGAGVAVPLVASVTFATKAGLPRRVPRLLAGTRVLWDVALLSAGEERALLDERGVHASAKAFWQSVSGQAATTTVPVGRTAHKDLGGMRSPIGGRGLHQEHWRLLDPAWSFARPAQRAWAAYSLCSISGVTPSADTGINFRPGRIAGDVHRIRAMVQHEVDLDRVMPSLNDTVPGNLRSPVLQLANWRLVVISENYWIGAGLGDFDAAPLRAEYDKAAVLITRGNGFVHGDKTVAWRTEYARLVPLLAAIPWARHAMLPQCGDHPAAFRSHEEYVDGTLPGVRNMAKRAVQMLFSSHRKEYARECERYASTVIKFVMWNLFPSVETGSAPAFLAPPLGRPPAGPPGLTVIQFAGRGMYNREAELQGGTYTSGLAPTLEHYNRRDKACFLTFDGQDVDAGTMVHEIGHHLFLAHAPGHYTPGKQPAGYQPGAHARNEWCLMSYQRDRRHFCGLCLMKLAGYDYFNHIQPDGTVV